MGRLQVLSLVAVFSLIGLSRATGADRIPNGRIMPEPAARYANWCAIPKNSRRFAMAARPKTFAFRNRADRVVSTARYLPDRLLLSHVAIAKVARRNANSVGETGSFADVRSRGRSVCLPSIGPKNRLAGITGR